MKSLLRKIEIRSCQFLLLITVNFVKKDDNFRILVTFVKLLYYFFQAVYSVIQKFPFFLSYSFTIPHFTSKLINIYFLHYNVWTAVSLPFAIFCIV
jgi:hypothetical protein